MWCAYQCSPYQSSFVEVTGSYSGDKIPELENITGVAYDVTYYMNSHYAQALYDSCRATTLNGGVIVGAAYTNPKDFLYFLGTANPLQNISFVFTDEGWMGKFQTCEEMCPCETCKEVCYWDMDYIFSTPCTMNMFEGEWRCDTVYLTISYAVFIIITLLTVILVYIKNNWKAYKEKDENDRSFTAILSLLILPIVGIFIMIIGLILWPILIDDQYIQIFDTYMNGWSFAFICLGLSLIYLSLWTAAIIVLANITLHRNSKKEDTLVFDFHKQLESDDDVEKTQSTTKLAPSINSYDMFPNVKKYVEKAPKKGIFKRYFAWHGRMCARHPFIVVSAGILLTILFSLGIFNFQLQNNPVALWASPSSSSYQQLVFNNENFGAFWRIEQMIFTSKNETDPTMIKMNILNEMLTIQEMTQNINASYIDTDGNTQYITLDDLCFQPIPGAGCLLETVLEYYQGNRTKLLSSGDPIDYIGRCLQSPLAKDCMSSIGSPVQSLVVYGGISNNDYLSATALIFTLLLNNNQTTNPAAMAYETEWLKIAGGDYTYVNVGYSAQRSVEDELTREGRADIPIVVLSYLIMFLYVSLALGEWYPRPRPWFMFLVKSRFSLGLAGVMIVLCSIVVSIGFNSLIGVKATLIISEVIPFLVLAIGVDNIFILVDNFEKTNPQLPIEDRMALTMEEVGASITVASLSESLAFLLGALTKMPAVQAFALYASVAIFFDFILQITCFISLLTLDTRRVQRRRMDCIPIVKVPDHEIIEEKILLQSDTQSVSEHLTYKKHNSLLQEIFIKYYTPVLLHPVTKFIVIIFFIGTFAIAIDRTGFIQLGLDQRVVLPEDSYLQTYYDDVSAYLEVGTPFYVIVQTDDYPYDQYDDQNILCSLPSCSFQSVVNQFDGAPYVAGTGFSWLDDYLSWANASTCCYVNTTSRDICTYFDNQNNPDECVPCFLGNDINGRPNSTDFYAYLNDFLYYDVAANCPMTGNAYISSIAWDDTNGKIASSRFNFYHTVLPTQNDFINALRTVYDLSDKLSEDYNIEIFPYAIWYVFFEQYLYIDITVSVTVGLALGSFFYSFSNLFNIIITSSFIFIIVIIIIIIYNL